MKTMKAVLDFFAVSVILVLMSCGGSETAEETENRNPMEENPEAQEVKLNRPITPNAEAKSTSLAKGMAIFEHTEVDQKPIYTSACQNSEDQWKCTVESVGEFVQKNIEWPENALKKGQDGREEVTFVVMPDGTVGNIKHVVSKETPCEGCQQAAVDVVSKLEGWKPGMKDGEAVAVKLTLPIKFKPM